MKTQVVIKSRKNQRQMENLISEMKSVLADGSVVSTSKIQTQKHKIVFIPTDVS